MKSQHSTPSKPSTPGWTLTQSDLHPYQVDGIQHLLANPYAALLADIGTGKSTMSQTAAAVAMAAGMMGKVLVVAPLAVARYTWSTEYLKWQQLEHLRVSMVLGTPAQRRKALASDADLYVINVDNLLWLFKEYPDALPFDALIIDELSMFKDRTTKRWKALSKRIGEFEWRWGLTGTPAPNHLMEMWAQMFLLDAGTRLGPLFTRFRALHFYALDYNEYEWAPFEGAEEKIYESLRDICFRAELTGHAPALRNVIRLELPHEARELYKQIKTEMATVYKNCDVVAPNPAVVVGKLLQITSGRVYDDARNVLDIHDVKIRALEQLVTSMQGEPLLVVYGYQHELEAIRTALPAARMLDSEEAIEAWNRGEIEVGLAHAASLGHGVNLQHGGHHMVWTTPTFSNEQHEQMIGRLKRQGQQHQVVVHYLVMDGTVDEMVLEVLDGKQSRQQAALEALK